MREIKFRAWDNITETMSPASTLNQLLTSATRLGVTLDGSMTLMQYTGLKDKNGVEIYEGDIMESRYLPLSERDYRKFVVESLGWAFVATPEDRYPDNSQSNFFANHASNFEVIGNIYENPELLNDN